MHGFLDSLPVTLASAVVAERNDEADPQWAGRRIGAYRIVREIGRGGMARVFLAERATGDFDRQVALKLLRPGLDTEIDRRRFRAEQQILASLEHPRIARLHDGGVSDDGQPYLVLEYVDGQPIDDYCDAKSLNVRQRLELFVKVIEAVQFAHRNLIVHRDLKPSNIFIDRDGQVKLLDFGLATLLQPGAPANARPRTRTHQRWLTPEYAAPEQILGEAISTLTDVYQLGAVLYRLLAGSPPFARDASFHELEAAVLGRDPDPPSATAGRSSSSKQRALRGDIDAIILKALQKRPDERYASAESLGEDVRRHLLRLPVLARRQTAGYRARRFVRRHGRETVAAMAVVLSLVVGAGGSVTQGRRAATQRDRAEAASRRAAGVTSFVLGLFEVSDPAEARGDTLRPADLVRRGVARAEQMRGSPAEQASMLEVTSQLYVNLGRFADAHAVLARALQLRRTVGRADGLEVAETLTQLGTALRWLGRITEADSVTRQALGIQQRILGASDPALATTLHRLGDLAVFRGEIVLAEAYHSRALALRMRSLGPGDSLTGVSHLHLGSIVAQRGRADDAEREFRTALEIFERVLGPYHALTAEAVLHIGYVLRKQPARRVEAGALYRRGLEIRRRVYGEGHPMTAYALSDLVDFLAETGVFATAVPLARKYLATLERAYGTEHPVISTALSEVGNTLHLAGDLVEAESLYRKGLALQKRIRNGDHDNVAGHEVDLARLLIDRGRYSEAESLLRDAVRIRMSVVGPQHPNTALTRGILGMLLTRTGDYVGADTLIRGAIRTMERQVSPGHPTLRQLEGWLAELDSTRQRRGERGSR